MRLIRGFINSLIAALLFSTQILAYENLDELEARKPRKTTNTFYSAEDAGNYYIRQPQTIIYKDTSTYHEVWVWSQTNNKATMGTRWSASEYNWQPWSADGKRIAFYQDVTVGCYTRTGHPWFTARSDGTCWRPMRESSSRASTVRFYPDWSPILPDVMYVTGANYDGNSGKDENAVYREVVSDTTITSTLIVDMIGGDTSTERFGGLKSRITGDGLYLVEGNYLENQPYYIIQIEPAGSRKLKLSWNLPTLDTYWYSTVNPASGHAHDEGVAGNAAEGYWFYFMPTGASVWWRIHLWGSDDLAPNHTIDHSAPYDWWTGSASQTEIQVVGDEYGLTYGNHPTFATDEWWSHGVFDRWGTYVLYSDVENPTIGPGAMRLSNYLQTGMNTRDGGAQYHSWQAWSDYFVSSTGNPAIKMGATLYNSSLNSNHVTVANLHSATTGDFSNPGQSPDGTKMAMRSDWLNPTSGVADLFIGVVYYPYPPEITSSSATGGTVTVQFNWRTDQTKPRTYTTRGWPDEDNDDPCPPRETMLFRLWRSKDKSSWTPLGIANADIFTRYDFSNGTWKAGYSASSTWSITDSPGDGIWYYAVTAVEWSGLESRTLSNIYSITVSSESGTGSQNTAYPTAPGDTDNITSSDFYTSFSSINPELIRYYNIYAEDGAIPSVNQMNRIASIAVNNCTDGSCSWIDWLGNTNGTTQYVVTAIDYQGNESNATYVTNQTFSHRSSPATAAGQYTIQWNDMREADIDDTPPEPPSGLRIVE